MNCYLNEMKLRGQRSQAHFIFLFSIAFVPHIDQLFDREVLIAKGWTTNESLQPLAHSTLANLVHHVQYTSSVATSVTCSPHVLEEYT